MSVTVETLLGRIESAIEGITPVKDREARFRLLSEDMHIEGASATSGMKRGFTVEVGNGADVENAYHHPLEREVEQLFQITVQYPDGDRPREQDVEIAHDIASITNVLDDPTSWGADVIFQWLPTWAPPVITPADGKLFLQLLVEVRHLKATT